MYKDELHETARPVIGETIMLLFDRICPRHPRFMGNIRRRLADRSIGIKPPRLLCGRAANYGSIINLVSVIAGSGTIRTSQIDLSLAPMGGRGAQRAAAHGTQECI